MTPEEPVPQSVRDEVAHERRQSVKGLLFAFVLTLTAFLLVRWEGMSARNTIIAVFALGAAQMAVHFRYFLHLGFRNARREDLLQLIFTLVLAVLMVGGTLWIILGMNQRMMPGM